MGTSAPRQGIPVQTKSELSKEKKGKHHARGTFRDGGGGSSVFGFSDCKTFRREMPATAGWGRNNP